MDAYVYIEIKGRRLVTADLVYTAREVAERLLEHEREIF